MNALNVSPFSTRDEPVGHIPLAVGQAVCSWFESGSGVRAVFAGNGPRAQHLPSVSRAERIVVAWAAWGGYHHARFRALRERCSGLGIDAVGLDVYGRSTDYGWARCEQPNVVRLELVGDENGFPTGRALARLIGAVRDLRPSVMFIPGYNNWSLVLCVVARLYRSQVVIMTDTHIATARPGGLRERARSVATRRAGALLVAGSPHRRYFEGLGVCSRRIFDGYDVVDNEFFRSVSAETRQAAVESRRRLGLTRPFVLAVARFIPKKSLQVLLAAHAIVRERLGPDAPDLVLLGQGPLEQELRQTALELGLTAGAGVVVFRSTFDQTDVAAMMALADTLVLPSELEEWGLVVNEAMAANCPVVVSRAVGCVEDLVEDGVTGLLFEPRDTGALAAHVITLASSPRTRERLAVAAAARISLWGCERFADGALSAARAVRPVRGRADWPRATGPWENR